MITNFEEITCQLTDDDFKVLPSLMTLLSAHTKDNPIKAPSIVEKIRSFGFTFNGVKLRKICNHIRSQSLLPLIATSDGYYVSGDKKDIERQIKSLEDRARAILFGANGLRQYIAKNIVH